MDRLLRHEKVRFVMTGFFNTGLDFVLLNTMVFLLGAYPVVANTISVTIGISISYILNHKFVFRQKGKLSIKKYLSFFAVTGFSSLVIQNVIIFVFTEAARVNFGQGVPILEWAVDTDFIWLNTGKATAVLVGMIWNFTLYKFVIFRKKEEQGEPVNED